MLKYIISINYKNNTQPFPGAGLRNHQELIQKNKKIRTAKAIRIGEDGGKRNP